VNFIRPFISPDGQAWDERRTAALRNIKSTVSEDPAIKSAIANWEKSQPLRAGITDVADHIDHIRKIAGIDHIGIGADFFKPAPEDMVRAGRCEPLPVFVRRAAAPRILGR